MPPPVTPPEPPFVTPPAPPPATPALPPVPPVPVSTHIPSWQLWPAAHTTPQVPQFEAFVFRFAQLVPQTVSPGTVQLVPQTLAEQTWP
jgi:hypothetical protein